ncbi:hypothetical protein CHU98_g12552 [Xylaria longipes]|nr:hypothetical protein CHU98_g12552 [Xylaria longipes]
MYGGYLSQKRQCQSQSIQNGQTTKSEGLTPTKSNLVKTFFVVHSHSGRSSLTLQHRMFPPKLAANLLDSVSMIFDIYGSSIYDIPSLHNGDQGEYLKPLTYGKVARKRAEVIINWTLTMKPKLNISRVIERNLIYVAASLLADPDTECLPYESRMIVGNVGRPGVSMMIPPADPVLRKPELESWRIINHESLTADSECTDMFDKTSLHLSFTGFEQPVGSTLKRGAHDLEACYLETVVTVFDGSEKVGDLAILDAMDGGVLLRKLPNSACPHSLRPLQCPRWLVVDSWAELLEMPRGRTCIIRAHGNGLSRLATLLDPDLGL